VGIDKLNTVKWIAQLRRILCWKDGKQSGELDDCIPTIGSLGLRLG